MEFVGVVTVVVGKLCSSQDLQFCAELGLVGLTCNLVSQTYSYLLKSCNCAAVRLESLMRSSRAVQVCACRAEAISMLLHCKVFKKIVIF